ncbi:TRAFAC clade GTPase domain-containing protein [Rufibacter latericius]|uniref:Double-GTPase 1 domain-containing protein n=1 Tax=Rufibacter latericius TaxID=2487040 RepID=A0A3M9MCS4_9BACT|nr:hypothetical protein [Rufibacter latericius]RNI23370.1 hypothetical protein EFB08_17635 [Rufibacter latericius]
MNKSILLIGRPHSSKTVFITQFYSKLRKGKSKLTLHKPVDDLTTIAPARDSLANGEEPQSTPAESNLMLFVPIKFNEVIIDLACPDYGGEQINKIIRERNLDKKWLDSIKSSNNWLLFIRLSSIDRSIDISNVTVTKEYLNKDENNFGSVFTISDQSFLIELLQILLDAKGHDFHFNNNQVKLVVALTCWDELNTDERPKDILKSNLPLLLDFIEANWSKESVKVLGLSAQGFSLNNPDNKLKYKTYGPEAFGYIINEEGGRVDDITELILEAL